MRGLRRILWICAAGAALAACGGSGGGSSGSGGAPAEPPVARRVVALLPMTGEKADRGAALEAGLEEMFAAPSLAGITLEVLDTGGDRNVARDLYYGRPTTETEEGVEGCAADADVLAVVVSTSGDAAAVTSGEVDDPPLVIACTATATSLADEEDLLLLAPTNEAQMEALYDLLATRVEASGAMLTYAVVREESPGSMVYAFDLFSEITKRASVVEQELQSRNGLDATSGAPIPYAQLVGSFSFDGGNADGLAAALTALAPDTVIYVGYPDLFRRLWTAYPAGRWIATDGVYDPSVLTLDADLTVLALGQPDPADYYRDYGRDAGGFLGAVFGVVGRDAARAAVREAARGVTYDGLTGTKGFGVATPGVYQPLRAAGGAWSASD